MVCYQKYCDDCNKSPVDSTGYVWDYIGSIVSPLHRVKMINMTPVAQHKGNLAGCLNDYNYEAVCGLRFTKQVDSGD